MHDLLMISTKIVQGILLMLHNVDEVEEFDQVAGVKSVAALVLHRTFAISNRLAVCFFEADTLVH